MRWLHLRMGYRYAVFLVVDEHDLGIGVEDIPFPQVVLESFCDYDFF
jgi:hypothetical protein